MSTSAGRRVRSALAPVALNAMSASTLNAIQLRCQAVLAAGTCGKELREAATTLLQSGEPSKRARQAGGCMVPPSALAEAASSKAPAKKASKKGWTCAKCTLQNDELLMACKACSEPRRPKATGDGWACTACTMMNASRAARCSACGEARAKRKPRQTPQWVGDDEEDDDAFAAPKAKPARAAAGRAAAPAAPPPPPDPDGAEEDEWETVHV